MTRIVIVSACLLPSAVACVKPVAPASAPEDVAILFDDMGGHGRKITTASANAQRYFDQGLTWAFAFNHDEAIRSFRTAARLDPNCAMAYWGMALCHGPHINNMVVTPEHASAAWSAAQQALALPASASPVEQALIDAVATRYADPPPADRKPLDEAYAEAMGRVWATCSKDADIGALYAEALMDLQPWDLWTKDGSPKGRVEEIVRVLDAVLELSPDHPGGLHLYIHALEGSPNPAKALAAADRLRERVPASGHLTHMPSHIDARVGHWSKAAEQNEKAVRADRKYRAISPRQRLYAAYMAHNIHFLSFASMMEGRSERALTAARQMLAEMPPEFIRDMPAFADPFMTAAMDALKRFGRWDEMLAEPPPPSGLPFSRAMWRFNRGVALAAKGEVSSAMAEQRAFRAAVRRVPADAVAGNNLAHKVLDVAEHVLSGEIALGRGDIDEAVGDLRRAVEAEDALLYDEPPDWIQPARHTLGAVLVSAGRFEEAEQVYREDLRHWPENGWSLYGLARCLRGRGAEEEAAEVDALFAAAWKRADVKIGSSCLCVPSRPTRVKPEFTHPVEHGE